MIGKSARRLFRRFTTPDVKAEQRHSIRLPGLASSFSFPRQPFSLESFTICVEGLFRLLVIGRGLRHGLLEETVRLLRRMRLGIPSHRLSSISLVVRTASVSATSWCPALCGLMRSYRPEISLEGSYADRFTASSPAGVISSRRSIALACSAQWSISQRSKATGGSAGE